MKKVLLIALLSGCFGSVYNSQAQQLPQYSQYMLNPYLLNPAVAGTSDHYDFKAGFRKQWVGLKDADGSDVAPQTFYVTGHGHLGKDHQRLRGRHKNQNSWHHGLGFQFISDKTGPTSINDFKVSYSYDMSITKKTRISFGLNTGIKSWALDVSKIRLSDGTSGTAGNAYLSTTDFSKIVPDLGVGIWVYHKLYYFGASVDQLLMSSLGNQTIYNNTNNNPLIQHDVVNRLTQHYFITGGGIFHPSREIAVIPSVLLKSAYGVVNTNSGLGGLGGMSVDLNVKVRYNNLVWGGLSYRSSDAFVVLLGVLINKSIEIGYSYDYTLSLLNAASSGSHEIMVGYRLEPRAHILSPSDFW